MNRLFRHHQPTAPTTTPTTTIMTDHDQSAAAAAAAAPPLGDDCPLCCEPSTAADMRYPMICKTSNCSFDFCLACLEKLYKSSNEGYSVASDGSNQVKIHLVCPMCRAPYNNCNNNTTNTTTTNAAEIVGSVILLRQAAKLLGSGGGDTHHPHGKGIVIIKDSDRCASELARRNEFCQVTSFPDLIDAVRIVQRYYDSIEASKGGRQPHPILSTRDCEAWEPYLDAERGGLRTANSFTKEQGEPMLKRDQTLFYALEDFLTDDEQEFITALMTSGKPELLSQAAYLIYTVMAPPPPPPSSSTSTTSNGRVRRRPLVRESTSAQIEHRRNVRKRFPLPPHMPRCVSLPIYDPLDRRNAPLKFAVHPTTSDVTLRVASVRGAAAKVGLQAGDVVTEVMGEMVSTYGELVVQLQQQQDQNLSTTFLVTVNSTPAVAAQLRERAVKMKEARVKFL
jgi:PDZ domain